MFTGLITTIGTLESRRNLADGQALRVRCRFDEEYTPGESIAVDGVCVTVETFDAAGFSFSASAETLKRSIIGEKPVGANVHLEKAMQVGDRLGGHIVQGHVDGLGQVVELLPRGTGSILRVRIPDELIRYTVEKGSIAIQGVSLTIAEKQASIISIALIPATMEGTLLGQLRSGDQVNLEVDIIAKYIESLTQPYRGIDEDKLREWGF